MDARRQLKPLGAATIWVVVGFIALIACLVLLGMLADSVRDQKVIALDTDVAPWIGGRSPAR